MQPKAPLCFRVLTEIGSGPFPWQLRVRRQRPYEKCAVVIAFLVGFLVGHFGTDPVKGCDQSRATSEGKSKKAKGRMKKLG